MQEIDEILDRHGRREDELIAILQDIQDKKNYLPEDALRYVAEGLGTPLSKVYSISTFFRAFSLEPRGRHLIRVCTGTTCHVRGASEILDEVRRSTGIANGQTNGDSDLSLETVNCMGTCALAPVITLDGKYFGKMNRNKIKALLRKMALAKEQ